MSRCPAVLSRTRFAHLCSRVSQTHEVCGTLAIVWPQAGEQVLCWDVWVVSPE